jgi:hypothetical protein
MRWVGEIDVVRRLHHRALLPAVFAACTVAAFPAAASTQTGPVRTLVIPISAEMEPITREQAHELVFGQVGEFIRRNSFGRVWLVGDTTPWLHVPNYDPDCEPLDLLLPVATDTARRAGFDAASYDRVAILNPTKPYVGCRNGYAKVTVKPMAVSVNGLIQLGSLAHELGHTFGMPHAGRFGGCPGRPTDVAHQLCVIYGDPYDVMGGSSSFGAYNAYEKYRAGWITNVTRAARNGAYVVDQLEQQSSLPQAFVVTTAGNEYWFDHREAIGDDAHLAGTVVTEGLLVHVGSNPRDPLARTRFRPSFFPRRQPVENLLYADPLGRGRDALIPRDTFGERGAFEVRVLAHVDTAVRLAFRWTDRKPPGAPKLKAPPKVARGPAMARWERARETGSGVEYYEVTVDRRPPARIEFGAPRALRVGRLSRGRHTVRVRAVDRAGNRGALAVRAFRVR